MLGERQGFDNRLKFIEKSHKRAPKRRAMVADNGDIVARRTRHARNVPVRGLLYLLIGFAIFKSIAMAQAGMPAYLDRVEGLRQGTFVEQAGAAIMQPDPLSIAIAAQIAPFLR